MKRLFATLGITIVLIACQAGAIYPEKLIGKWSPTYQVQNKNSDGTWAEWITINTLVALPPIEFTAKGEFLNDGKPGAQCCYAGNKYVLTDNIITFSDVKSCPEVKCMNCLEWQINQLDSEILIIETCNSRSKFARLK